jgi:hypothetical protein
MNFHTPAHKIFRILILIAMLTQAVVFAGPASAAGESPNPAAEAYLLSELRATGVADLQWNFAPEERGVSGAALLAALKDPEVQSKPLIYIANLTVTDTLWARDLIIPSNLAFAQVQFAELANFSETQIQSFDAFDSKFLGDLDLSGASIGRDLYFGNNTIAGNLNFGRSEIDGNADLRGNMIEGSLNFYGAHISGELLLDDTKVLGTEPIPGSSFPTEIWNTTVDGLASFNNMEFNGSAYFFGSHFDRFDARDVVFHETVSFGEATADQIADFSGTQFLGEANFTNFRAGSDINFYDAVFANLAIFENVFVERDANFQGSRFDGTANFYYFTAERFSDFSGATFHQDFQFYYATTAYPYFENTVFNGPVTFEGMQASEDFELINTSYNYPDQPFLATVASVDGVVNFRNFTAPAGLQLSDSTFGSFSLTTGDQADIQFVDLTGTTIEGDLSMEKVNLKDFLAEGMTVGGATTLHEVTISKQLDLRNASIGFLKVDEKFSPPTDSDSFNLRGMTYSDIDLGDQGLTDETWKGLLKFINDSAYSPQAYQALSQFLTDKGHPDWAAEVELAQKRRERDEVLTPLSGAWFWSWFLDIFAGYGHRPALAFIWSGLVVVTGALIFRRREDMCPVEQEDVQLNYNPIWYSFALFLPYIDLGIASKWEPSPTRKWARNYKYVHMLLGWVLAPIALLTFGGIIG